MSLSRSDIVVIVAFAAMASIPFIFGNYWTGLLTQALIFAGVALALDLLVGFTGLPSLGHAAFFGIGGYGMAISIQRWDISPWVAAGLGIAVSTLVAIAFSPVAVRVKGLAFLTVMLAFGQVWWGMATRGGSFTGGENGISGIPRLSLGLDFWSLDETDGFYYFALVGTGVVTFVLVRFARSSFGLSLIGIRDNDSRMETLGYNIAARRAVAFSVAASAGAFYGVLSTNFNQFVGPGSLDWRLSAQFLLSVVIGGAGSLWGPFAAGAGLHVLKTYVTGETQRWPMILGALYVFSVVALPGGIASIPAVVAAGRAKIAAIVADRTDEPART